MLTHVEFTALWLLCRRDVTGSLKSLVCDNGSGKVENLLHLAFQAVTNLAETVRTASPKLASVYAPLTDNLPKPPSVGVPFADKLPGPEDAVATAYDFAEQLLASQRKFAEDLLRAKPEGAVAGTYDFAEQLLASQRKFAEDLLQAAAPLAPGRAESAPATETYKPGQVVPRDGTVECARHHDVQDHVKAGTRFAPCSHHHEHSEGCTWQYV